MKLFLRNVLIFSVIVIALLGIGEIVARRLPSAYRYKHEWMLEHGREVSTLVLGSSHTYYGIKSDLFGDSVFNLANVSQTPTLDLMLLNKYRDSLVNLKRIILSVSYFTFVDPPMEETDMWFRIKDYKVQMDATDHSDFSRYNFEIADLDGFAKRLQSLVTKRRGNECDSLGWSISHSLSMRYPKWKDGVEQRLKSTDAPITSHADSIQADFGRIFRECEENDIECVVVSTPVWSGFYECMDKEQLVDMQRRMQELSAVYGVRYLNYMTDADFTDADFYDVDHLSDVGAVKFTRKLRKDLSDRR